MGPRGKFKPKHLFIYNENGDLVETGSLTLKKLWEAMLLQYKRTEYKFKNFIIYIIPDRD